MHAHKANYVLVNPESFMLSYPWFVMHVERADALRFTLKRVAQGYSRDA